MKAVKVCSTKDMTREKWLQIRQRGIGGSDIAKIAGLSPYGNAFTVYHEKTSPVAEYHEASEAAEIGTALEPWVCAEYTRRTGNKLQRVNAVLQHPTYPWMLANVDRVIVGRDKGVFEAKTAGGNKAAWEGGRIPDGYLLQVHWYLTVTGYPYAEIGALLGGHGGFEYAIRRVEADADISRSLIRIGEQFWQSVETRTPPPVDGSDESSYVLQQLYTGGEMETLTLPDKYLEAVALYHSAQLMEKAAEERKAKARNEMAQAMGNHEVALCSNFQLSWKPVTTNKVDVKQLKELYPQVYDTCLKASTSRTFRIKEIEDERLTNGSAGSGKDRHVGALAAP